MVGAHAAVADAVAGTGVRVVVNARWESGMFSSVRAGLAAVDPVSDLVLLSPADLPQLTADTVARVVAGAVEAGDEGLSVPTCEGRRGHPLALPAEIAEEILSWPEHARLDQALDGRWPVHALPGFGPEVLRDVDTRADAAAFAEAAS